MNDWSEKVAIVTGGSAGFGFALARQLTIRGVRVVLAARNAEPLNRAVAELNRQHKNAWAIPTDVTRQDAADALVQRTVERYHRLDLMINCAGRSDRGLALETPAEDYRQLLDLNFLGAVRCAQAAAPHLIQSQGHLINVASLAGKTASPYLGAYPPSKHALAAYTQQLRFELEPQGVHVLLVCPGPIERADEGERYQEQASGLPESASQPGGGVRIKRLDPDRLAEQVLACCKNRAPELVRPGKARLLFAISQLSPRLGDWLIRRMVKSK